MTTKEYKVWLVRISPRKAEAVRDYDYFLEEVSTNGQGLWDKDTRNRMRTGDYVGFITGPIPDAEVQLFRVVEERPVEARQSFWSVSHREVVVLTHDPEAPVGYSWNMWRRETGYAESFWPNGTMPTQKIPAVVAAEYMLTR